jgi:hypothetical protein
MATFGNTTAGGDTFPCSNDRALVSLFTLTEDGDLTQVNCRFSSGSTAGCNFKGLVYADSSGSPGARLGVGAATAVPAGGGVIASSITLSLSAGSYWLGYVTDSFQAEAEIETTGTLQRKEGLTYASPADPFGTPDGSSTEVCVYATYTASAAGYVPRSMLLGVG